MSDMKDLLTAVVNGKDLSEAEMRDAMIEIMEGRCSDVLIAALLVALRMKGETVDEIAGAAAVMREKAVRIEPVMPDGEPLADTCGTGGDGVNTFNISTAAAFVAAGAGVKVAKHGNRAVSSRSGSADVLEALGVDLSLSPADVASAIEQVGIGFLFAPALHPAMKHAIGPRREMGIRTMFNVLGPLTNPAGADCQVMGVFASGLTRVIAEVLGRLGSKRAWVVYGHGGIDELSLAGPSCVSEWTGKEVHDFTVDPVDAGLKLCGMDNLKGGTPDENANIIMRILSGEKGPARDITLLNAAAAILVAGKVHELKEGVEAAAESVDSGRAMGVLTELVRFCREVV